jgi:SAM-dependent methyltransferase
MIENYEILQNGIIKQINIKKITYNYDYSNKYNNYGEKGKYLSYLRYGVLLGAIKDTPKSIVDVGYGNGDFLTVCKKNIENVYGCDISDYPLPDGCKKIRLEDISGVDVVCFFDSLEHFEDISFIKNLNTKYIFISVPWCHNLSDLWFKNWYHRRENEHLYHFNEDSLKLFFKESGYDCIYTSSFEDIVRFNPAIYPLPNILSCIFIKCANE